MRFYEDQWVPWYEDEPRYGGIKNPLVRQYTWGAKFGGLYVDGDACVDMARLRELAA